AVAIANKDQFTTYLLENLKNDKNVFVASASKTYVKALQNTVCDEIEKSRLQMQKDDIHVHCADTDDSIKNRVHDINHEWRKRLTMATSAAGVGLSFTENHFHNVFLYGSVYSIAPDALAQICLRVRR